MDLCKIIILLAALTAFQPQSSATNLTVDQAALLSFKSLLIDPTGALYSWTSRASSPCNWLGVACSSGRNPRRVTALDLDSLNLTGPISPSLSNLSYLTRLHLARNKLNGNIPREFGLLTNLQYLNLSYNSLQGDIPNSLSHCSRLQNISLSQNHLQGEIPSDLANCSYLEVLRLNNNMVVGAIPDTLASLKRLSKLFLSNNQLIGEVPTWLGTSTSSSSTLTHVDLSTNNLEGEIPASLGNLSSLVVLDLSYNRLRGAIPPSLANCLDLAYLDLSSNGLEGRIPDSFANYSKLKELDISSNGLSGMVPSALYNLSSLQALSLGMNKLAGKLPADIGRTLPNLQQLCLEWNEFEGPIPNSFSYASEIEVLDLYNNEFSGVVPPVFGELQYLYQLNLGRNKLDARHVEDWNFLASLTNCTELIYLILHNNNFHGNLPSLVTNLSAHLEWLDLGSNQMSGVITAEINKLAGLTKLDLSRNFFSGTIPDEIGSLHSLHAVDLSRNRLSGRIPASLGNLTMLNELHLSENNLQGEIPRSFGRYGNLAALNLSYNQLDGLIPKEVGSITSLSKFLDLSHNSLTGSIPSEVGKLMNLAWLNAAYNKLSGDIPSTVGDCAVLQYLFLEGNSFEGPIPLHLSNLKVIQVLDLSHNNLSGPVPDFLATIRNLTYLNLSFNNFEGKVPTKGVFANLSAVSLYGNDLLCGGDPMLQLSLCPTEGLKERKKFHLLLVLIPTITLTVCMIFFSLFAIILYSKKKHRKLSPSVEPFSEDQYRKISYNELHKGTDGFSLEILIGAGSFGFVYKGRIDGYNKDIAVKVLNLQQGGAPESFMAECEVLRNIRHRNLMKILTTCATIDPKGNEFRALVFEFMPNGSLEDWLHPKIPNNSNSRQLSLAQRLNIAIDVASALEYLHHHGTTPIVHCDIKPSNVLLNDDMSALVGDFGLARFVTENKHASSQDPTSVAIRGSIGFLPPEYGMGDWVSTHGDVYSYGILLLELLTGKRPTDEMFNDGLLLHNFVKMAYPERIMDIVDPEILLLENEQVGIENQIAARERFEQCLVFMIGIALSCSNETPNARMGMPSVALDLHAIRAAYLEPVKIEDGTVESE